MASPVERMIRGTVTQAVLKLADFNRQRLRREGPHPYLSGIHTPLTREETFTDLAVQGTIPPVLDGLYVRNGPNPVTPPNPASYHWFTGTGMLHGLRLQGGRAQWYRNRWVRGLAASTALGEAPAPGPRVGGFDAPNTHVLAHAGKLWALVEAGGYPVHMDAELRTVAHDPFGGTLHHAFSAHPHRDPASGELHAVCYRATVQDTVWHVVVDAQGRVRREEPIRVAHGPSIHDCMLTERWVIVLDLPVTFSMAALVAGQTFPYRWNPSHRARVGLLGREAPGSSITWCDVDPCYVFHPANAYDTEDGQVVFDACVHSRMFDDAESADGPRSSATPLERWTIDPSARRVARQVLDPAPQEFPRINEAHTGRPYRYAYALGLREGGDEAFLAPAPLYKHDLVAGRRLLHRFGPDEVAGEFVFVPRDGGAAAAKASATASAEDDGWLMGLVIDRARGSTDLVILDAARFEDPPVARITVPQRIPPGFHGSWVPAAALA